MLREAVFRGQSGPGVSNSVTNRRNVTLCLGRAFRNAKHTTGNLWQNREICMILLPEDEWAVIGTRNLHCLVLGKLLSVREHDSAGCLVTSRIMTPPSRRLAKGSIRVFFGAGGSALFFCNLPLRTHDPTQSTKKRKTSTQPNSVQPSPRVDPIHGQLWYGRHPICDGWE